MAPGISVVICCYNSSERLPATIDYLKRQTVAGIPWEIVVIDNASSDNTADVAEDLLHDSHDAKYTYRIIAEGRPGLSFAREKGIDEAKYEFVLFCDDDNWLDNTYLQHAFDVISSNSCIAAIGGSGEAVCEIDAPEWLTEFESAYAIGVPQKKSGPFQDSKGFVFGAGMMIRKAAWLSLKRAGFKSLLSDRKGKELSSGGDLELCYAFRLAGFEVWFDNMLTYKHFITKERLSLPYLDRLHAGFGKSGVLLDAYQYALNNWPSDKKFLWMRVLVLMVPSYLKDVSNTSLQVRKRMIKIVFRNYVREMISLRSAFGNNISHLKHLKEVLTRETRQSKQ